MVSRVKSFLRIGRERRGQRPLAYSASFLAGVGGLCALLLLGSIGQISNTTMIIAPFGASAMLLFSMPSNPLSQPANVIGGYMIAAVLSMTLKSFLPSAWWTIAIGVGLTIAVLNISRLIHPPAGGVPVVILGGIDPEWSFLILPLLCGSVLLVITAIFYHRLTGNQYPHHPRVFVKNEDHKTAPQNQEAQDQEASSHTPQKQPEDKIKSIHTSP